MRLIGLSCVMIGLLLAGCQKPVAVDSADTTGMSAGATTPPPTPQYAPKGVFYLLTTIRKETKDGIIRLLPGTEVKLVRSGKYLTPEGEMALDPKVLTNDLTQARAARNADVAGQAAARPKGLANAWPATQASKAQIPEAAQPIAATKPSADAEAGQRAIKFRLGVLRQEEEKLNSNFIYLQEKASHAMRTQNAPAGLGGSTSLTDWSNIAAKLDGVRAEIQMLEGQLQSAAN